jgi:hypothetical protein
VVKTQFDPDNAPHERLGMSRSMSGGRRRLPGKAKGIA